MGKFEVSFGFGDPLSQWLGPFGLLAVSGLVLIYWYYFTKRLPDGKSFGGRTETARNAVADYNAWRSRLMSGGDVATIYAGMLSRALDALDRFYGDPPTPTGARPHTWTGPSLDRSLLIALIYPIMTLAIIWHLTGVSGPVERALGMPDQIETPGARALSALSIAMLAGSIFWLVQPPASQAGLIWSMVRAAAFAGTAAFAFANAVTVAVFGSLVCAFTVTFAVAGAIAVAVAVTVVVAASVAIALAEGARIVGMISGSEAVVSIVACAFVVAVAFAGANQRKSPVLLLFCAIMLAFTLVVVGWRPGWPPINGWLGKAGWIPLVFLGALPIINALFDWLSLGITRWLLRRGQGRGGLVPVIYAALDLLAAVVMLAGVMVASLSFIQLMNALSGQTIVDVDGLLATLRNDPGSPTVWWIYVTIFTTMVPSLVNLFLGGLAIVRGLPGFTLWIAEKLLPEDPRHLQPITRFWASVALSGQAAVAAIGALAVGWTGWWIVSTGMGMIGLGLLPMAEALNGWIKATV